MVHWVECWLAGWISEWLACCLPAGYSGVYRDIPAVWLAGCLTSGLRWLAGSTWFSITVLACQPNQPAVIGCGQGAVYAQLRGHWSPSGQIQLLASALVNMHLRLLSPWGKKLQSQLLEIDMMLYCCIQSQSDWHILKSSCIFSL